MQEATLSFFVSVIVGLCFVLHGYSWVSHLFSLSLSLLAIIPENLFLYLAEWYKNSKIKYVVINQTLKCFIKFHKLMSAFIATCTMRLLFLFNSLFALGNICITYQVCYVLILFVNLQNHFKFWNISKITSFTF